MAEEKTCPVCGALFTGDSCPECGRRDPESDTGMNNATLNGIED